MQYAGATLQRAARLLGARRHDRRRTSLRDVDRADGAALAVSRAAAERAGLLDETLFVYVEDVEWSLRIRRAGFAVVFVPGARVRHKGSAASGGRASTTNLYYDTRNTIVVAERHAPLPRGARALRRGVIVGAHLAQAVRHPARLAAARAVLAGWRDARAGRLGSEQLGVDGVVSRAVSVPRVARCALEPAPDPLVRRREHLEHCVGDRPRSCGSKSRAASPTVSGSAAAFEHATGHPHAIASSGGRPKPS